MRLTNPPWDEATHAAMQKALALVLIPGAIFVFGLIYLVSPRRVPPSQSWANGTYINACCAPVTLHNGTITTDNGSAHYVVREGKLGLEIDVDQGIGVTDSRVRFGGNSQFVFFNNASETLPALGKAESLHLWNLDDSTDLVFVKR